MGRVSYRTLVEMQQCPQQIRNVCILAHVDHGKTSIADLLIATNSIINKRQAGKLRYLDDRQDEQERGITMKSSTIALYHRPRDSRKKEYLVNLIDTPGHIDFATEVTAAARLSDGVLIVVDVLEGVCPQTWTVIESAIVEKAKMILVLNKIDRLIIDKNLSCVEIFTELRKIIQSINAYVAGLRFRFLVVETEGAAIPEQKDEEFNPTFGNVVFASAIDGWAFRLIDMAEILSKQVKKDVEWLSNNLWGDTYFNKKQKEFGCGPCPDHKKLFVSMILMNIVDIYDSVLRTRNPDKVAKIINKLELKNRSKEMSSFDKRAQLRAIMSEWLPMSECLFRTFIEVVLPPTKITTEKIHHILGATSGRDLNGHTIKQLYPFIQCCSSEPDAPVIAYITKMMPVDKRNIVKEDKKLIPTEVDIQTKRENARKYKQLIAEKGVIRKPNEIQEYLPILDIVHNAIEPQNECMSSNEIHNDAQSQNQAVSADEINGSAQPLNQAASANEIYDSSQTQNLPSTSQIPTIFGEPFSDPDVNFIACVRIFSGELKVGSVLYLLPSDHNPCTQSKESTAQNKVVKIDVTSLYMMMGRDFFSIESAMAGNVIGIGHLNKYLIRCGTVSSTTNCFPLFDVVDCGQVEPFYRCAIEPRHVSDMPALLQGIKFLLQADSCAQCVLQRNGQYVLMTAGQVHLDKCVADLQRFAGVPFTMSTPMVQLCETVLPTMGKREALTRTRSKTMKELGLKVEIQAMQYLPNLERAIQDNFAVLKLFDRAHTQVKDLGLELWQKLSLGDNDTNHDIEEELIFDQKYLDQAAEKVLKSVNKVFESVGKMWYNAGNRLMAVGHSKADNCVLFNFTEQTDRNMFTRPRTYDLSSFFNQCITDGFQMAIRAGPICEEPMRGVLFALIFFELEEVVGLERTPAQLQARVGLYTSAFRDAFLAAFSALPQRLMEPMFESTTTVPTTLLGKFQQRLYQHNGIINNTNMISSDLVIVAFIIPVLESLQFCTRIRADTQGKVNPLLSFSHYSVVDGDPYMKPQEEVDEEEYETTSENRGHALMLEVRRRKGLHVDQKLVAHAEKQRTLNKKKMLPNLEIWQSWGPDTKQYFSYDPNECVLHMQILYHLVYIDDSEEQEKLQTKKSAIASTDQSTVSKNDDAKYCLFSVLSLKSLNILSQLGPKSPDQLDVPKTESVEKNEESLAAIMPLTEKIELPETPFTIKLGKCTGTEASNPPLLVEFNLSEEAFTIEHGKSTETLILNMPLPEDFFETASTGTSTETVSSNLPLPEKLDASKSVSSVKLGKSTETVTSNLPLPEKSYFSETASIGTSAETVSSNLPLPVKFDMSQSASTVKPEKSTETEELDIPLPRIKWMDRDITRKRDISAEGRRLLEEIYNNKPHVFPSKMFIDNMTELLEADRLKREAYINAIKLADEEARESAPKPLPRRRVKTFGNSKKNCGKEVTYEYVLSATNVQKLTFKFIDKFPPAPEESKTRASKKDKKRKKDKENTNDVSHPVAPNVTKTVDEIKPSTTNEADKLSQTKINTLVTRNSPEAIDDTADRSEAESTKAQEKISDILTSTPVNRSEPKSIQIVHKMPDAGISITTDWPELSKTTYQMQFPKQSSAPVIVQTAKPEANVGHTKTFARNYKKRPKKTQNGQLKLPVAIDEGHPEASHLNVKLTTDRPELSKPTNQKLVVSPTTDWPKLPRPTNQKPIISLTTDWPKLPKATNQKPTQSSAPVIVPTTKTETEVGHKKIFKKKRKKRSNSTQTVEQKLPVATDEGNPDVSKKDMMQKTVTVDRSEGESTKTEEHILDISTSTPGVSQSMTVNIPVTVDGNEAKSAKTSTPNVSQSLVANSPDTVDGSVAESTMTEKNILDILTSTPVRRSETESTKTVTSQMPDTAVSQTIDWPELPKTTLEKQLPKQASAAVIVRMGKSEAGDEYKKKYSKKKKKRSTKTQIIQQILPVAIDKSNPEASKIDMKQKTITIDRSEAESTTTEEHILEVLTSMPNVSKSFSVNFPDTIDKNKAESTTTEEHILEVSTCMRDVSQSLSVNMPMTLNEKLQISTCVPDVFQYLAVNFPNTAVRNEAEFTETEENILDVLTSRPGVSQSLTYDPDTVHRKETESTKTVEPELPNAIVLQTTDWPELSKTENKNLLANQSSTPVTVPTLKTETGAKHGNKSTKKYKKRSKKAQNVEQKLRVAIEESHPESSKIDKKQETNGKQNVKQTIADGNTKSSKIEKKQNIPRFIYNDPSHMYYRFSESFLPPDKDNLVLLYSRTRRSKLYIINKLSPSLCKEPHLPFLGPRSSWHYNMPEHRVQDNNYVQQNHRQHIDFNEQDMDYLQEAIQNLEFMLQGRIQNIDHFQRRLLYNIDYVHLGIMQDYKLFALGLHHNL